MTRAARLFLRTTGPIAFWLSWPLSYVVLRHSERSRVVVLHDDAILVVRAWHSRGEWSLPGGGITRHEDPVAGAVRELHEEVGLTAPQAALRPLGRRVYQYAGIAVTCQYFLYTMTSRPSVRPHMPEIIDARCIPLSQIHTYRLGPDVRQALRVLAQQK